jgi:hypothetical protein
VDDGVFDAPVEPSNLQPEGPEGSEQPEDGGQATVRLAIASAFPVLAAASVVGGVFVGVGGRVVAAVAAILGVALGYFTNRLRAALWINLAVFIGVFGIGLVLVLPTGVGNLGSLRGEVARAVASGDVLRPPVAFSPGWHAIVGWIMGCIGLATAWVALTFRKPALAMLVPLPAAAVAAISVPHDQQVGSGLAIFVMFAIGLGLLSGSGMGDGDQPITVAYTVRRMLRSLPLLVVATVGLALLSQAHFLFPHPSVDPTHKPQKPKATPLSAVKDRVLFEVQSSVTGPWRLGSLDVYDGHDWRLPPLAQGKLKAVPRSGIVDRSMKPGVRATFTVAGLGGAVLPSLPNTVGILAEGPKLAYDSRNGNIRLSQGQIQAGLQYTVVAAALPSVQDLAAVKGPVPADLAPFTQIPPPPPAVRTLLAEAAGKFPDKWNQFNYVRTYVLDHVTSTGAGAPAAVTPDRVQQMLAGSKEGSPFEIVAAQAMLARWVGVPSRIGYGFDGGEMVNGKLQIRPKDGATFVEVAFPGYGWLPVIGTPKQAKPTTGDTSQQKTDSSILPSNDISIQVFIPIVLSQPSIFLKQVQRVVLIVVPILLLLLAIYLLLPAIAKALRRSRRRGQAMHDGPRARIGLAYSEWRDHATDFGYGRPTETPLQYLARFADDDEQRQLAWLVTRAVWGDLRDGVDDNDAATAEELSRALRKRLSMAHPPLLRIIALVSRLSLRDPYALPSERSWWRTDRAAA